MQSINQFISQYNILIHCKNFTVGNSISYQDAFSRFTKDLPILFDVGIFLDRLAWGEHGNALDVGDASPLHKLNTRNENKTIILMKDGTIRLLKKKLMCTGKSGSCLR
jgi:hypothetical protein